MVKSSLLKTQVQPEPWKMLASTHEESSESQGIGRRNSLMMECNAAELARDRS